MNTSTLKRKIVISTIALFVLYNIFWTIYMDFRWSRYTDGFISTPGGGYYKTAGRVNSSTRYTFTVAPAKWPRMTF